MIHLDPRNQDEARCPKRLWVMLTLSDDELVDGHESLPLGLRLHLAQCESCRALSERLLDVSGGLEALGADEPNAGLFAQADRRLASALAAVPVPPARPAGNGRGNLRRLLVNGKSAPGAGVTRYVAAAVVAVAALLPVLWFADGAGDGAARQTESARGVPDSRRLVPLPGSGNSAHRAEPDGVDPGPGEEPGVPGTQPGLAEAITPDAGRPEREPRICTFDEYGSPAGPDDATCIYRGFQLPRRPEPPRKRR